MNNELNEFLFAVTCFSITVIAIYLVFNCHQYVAYTSMKRGGLNMINHFKRYYQAYLFMFCMFLIGMSFGMFFILDRANCQNVYNADNSATGQVLCEF